MSRAIVSVTNDLNTDQRVAKTCDTLVDLGYEVLLVGRKLKSSTPISRSYKTKRFNLLFNKSFLFYAEYNFRLFFFLLFSKKKLLISNDLDTLLPNYIISKLQRKKLVYDSHEIFTEVPELVDKSFVRRFWTSIEKRIFPKLKNVIVVSPGVADYYEKAYNVHCHIVRNIPKEISVKPLALPFDHQGKKTILYQGSINMGRGLELMIDAMSLLEDYIFMIAGDGDIIETLKEQVKQKELENSIIFLGKLGPAQLKSITPLADIGISLEEDLGLNYRYALPNKVFDYIHAEIPVVVSDLPEMKKIVETHQIGRVLKDRRSKELSSLIKSMDKRQYSNALKKTKKELSWSVEKEKLIHIFKHLN
ncbi:glycosyltransferase [Flavobacteriaceae bacterium S356]|uniref:Glycosyltransferase n=1 Tax=Asprobacillus argus TaxID=3076534 RepID=A0ABU3LIG4_9FLAO|nr:glycosyltransferase [Flavobacteriaceae bacterium S356]